MTLQSEKGLPHQNVSRVGVYGVAKRNHRILLVTQTKGPYAGKLDFPGGGIEFGETIDQTLHREFLEEVNMDFDSMEHIENLTVCIEVASKNDVPPYMFHHIGLIYVVTALRIAEANQTDFLMNHAWADIETLRKDAVTPFVWAIIQKEGA